MESLVITGHSGQRITENLPFADPAASNIASFGTSEDGPDLSPACNPLRKLRLKQHLQSSINIINELVDHIIEPNIDPFGLCHPLGARVHLHIKADHNRSRSNSQVNIRLANVAGSLQQDLDLEFINA